MAGPHLDSGDIPPDDADLQAALLRWRETIGRLETVHDGLRRQVRALQEQLRRQDDVPPAPARDEYFGRRSAGALRLAEDVRGRLETAKSYLALLRRRLGDDDGAVGLIDKTFGELADMEGSANDLLSFIGDNKSTPRPVAIGPLVEELCRKFEPRFAEHGVAVDADIEPDSNVLADERLLRQALRRLICDALVSMPDGGELLFTGVKTVTGYELEVADSGLGLPGGSQARLEVVRRVMLRQGGDALAQNCPDGGAAITLRFPLADEQRGAKAA